MCTPKNRRQLLFILLDIRRNNCSESCYVLDVAQRSRGSSVLGDFQHSAGQGPEQPGLTLKIALLRTEGWTSSPAAFPFKWNYFMTLNLHSSECIFVCVCVWSCFPLAPFLTLCYRKIRYIHVTVGEKTLTWKRLGMLVIWVTWEGLVRKLIFQTTAQFNGETCLWCFMTLLVKKMQVRYEIDI